jgi:hypothetical protein
MADNMFVEMAKAIGQSQALNTEQAISDLRLRKKSVNQMLDAAIAQEELKKTEQDKVKEDIKYEEKRTKIRQDLLKSAIDQGAGPVAVGGNLMQQFAPDVEPEAVGLPLLDQNSQSL